MTSSKNTGYLTRVHVNQHIVKKNKKEGTSHPAITIKSNKDEAYYVWALGPWDDYKSEVKMGPNEHVHYVRCFSEKDLLDKFIDHWQVNYPDVVTGWNSTLFDWNYLINRFINVFNDGVPKKFWNGKKRQYEDYQISIEFLLLATD